LQPKLIAPAWGLDANVGHRWRRYFSGRAPPLATSWPLESLGNRGATGGYGGWLGGRLIEPFRLCVFAVSGPITRSVTMERNYSRSKGGTPRVSRPFGFGAFLSAIAVYEVVPILASALFRAAASILGPAVNRSLAGNTHARPRWRTGELGTCLPGIDSQKISADDGLSFTSKSPRALNSDRNHAWPGRTFKANPVRYARAGNALNRCAC